MERVMSFVLPYSAFHAPGAWKAEYESREKLGPGPGYWV